jgi:voltage-gated potassium channel
MVQARATTKREDALRRFEAAVELPLLVLSVAIVPLLVVPLVVDLSHGAEEALLAVDWFIWAVFAFEYVTRLVLTTDRWRFVRSAWLDLLMVAVPFLRPLRVARSARALRMLRLARLLTVLGYATRSTRRLLVAHHLHYAVLLTIVIVAGSAAAVQVVESDEGSIHSYGDALWWAMTTITTVGYGDAVPVTAAGRGVAVFLMIAGIAFFGVLTANVAAFFLEHAGDDGPTADDKLDEILRRLTELERAVRPDQAEGSSPA